MTSPSQNLPILTISQITHAIKLQLERTFPLLWLQGEISNLKVQTSGHLYFSLKDAQAQIAAVMFRGDASGLKFTPKDGDSVIIRGELTVYPPSGRYQVTVREIKQVGLGELLLRLEELKIKLKNKGYFLPEHKKPLPKFPKRIGVVTSPTGAVIRDIVNVLTRRLTGFHLVLNPVKVQGEGSAQEIARAIAQFNEHDMVDVMIVGRGGGSMEDLWPFNEEIVADAIYRSRIPIVCAVGHETDHCIAEYVADVRAPTPSAAAEIISGETAQYLKNLHTVDDRLRQILRHILKGKKQHLQALLKQPLLSNPYALLGFWFQRVDDFRKEVDRSIRQKLNRCNEGLISIDKQVQGLKPSTLLTHHRQKLNSLQKSFDSIIESKLYAGKAALRQKNEIAKKIWSSTLEARKKISAPETKRRQLNLCWHRQVEWRIERLNKLVEALRSVDPKNLLNKGYAILFSEKEGSVIKSVQTLEIDQPVRILLADGELLTNVKEIFRK